MGAKYDFGGYATKNNIKCFDGRVILRDAFAEQDGKTIPLVWSHQHGSNDNVLGHAVLENRKDGVYAYCSLNDTKSARNAKKQIQHGDITSLSIYANGLKQRGNEVVHGIIRELSLVLAGANEGAVIDSLYFAHGADGMDEDEAIITFGEDIALSHSAEDDEEDEDMGNGDDIVASMTDEQREFLYDAVAAALNNKEGAEEYDDDEELVYEDEDEEEVEEDGDEEEIEEDDSEEYEEDGEMKHDVFMDGANSYDGDAVLTQGEYEDLMRDAKACGSFKEAALAHAAEYGIENIDYMFPDYHNLNNGEPELVKKKDEWVSTLMGGITKSPFAKVRYLGADITADEARARGYLKGNRKIEQVYTLMRRTTDPTTVYAKQKFNKDDLDDLAKNWNAVAFAQKTMATVWEYEVARAILVGDGRSSASEDKIDEMHIRPVWTDDTFFSVNHVLNFKTQDTAESKASALIDEMVKARREYRGSGNLTFFTTEDWIDDMMLLKDGIGHRLFKTEAELCAAMRVKQIVPVLDLENLTRSVDGVTHNLIGIALDCSDYTVGADNGGQIKNYEQFDIDYNQQKYLREGRCSGALTKYHSAIIMESVQA